MWKCNTDDFDLNLHYWSDIQCLTPVLLILCYLTPAAYQLGSTLWENSGQTMTLGNITHRLKPLFSQVTLCLNCEWVILPLGDIIWQILISSTWVFMFPIILSHSPSSSCTLRSHMHTHDHMDHVCLTEATSHKWWKRLDLSGAENLTPVCGEFSHLSRMKLSWI